MRRRKKTQESMFENNGKRSAYSRKEGLGRGLESGGVPFGTAWTCFCVSVCDCLKLCSALIVAFKVHKVNKSLVKAHIVEEKGLSVRVMFKC